MKITQRVKRRFKPFFDVSSWMSKDFLVAPARDLNQKFRQLFSINRAKNIENFDSAMRRLDMDENALVSRLADMRRMFYMFLLIGLGISIYGILSFIQGFFFSSFICVGLTGFALAMMFRYHFWMFQIKQRQLGCSLKDWLFIGLLGKKVNSGNKSE